MAQIFDTQLWKYQDLGSRVFGGFMSVTVAPRTRYSFLNLEIHRIYSQICGKQVELKYILGRKTYWENKPVLFNNLPTKWRFVLVKR